MTYPQQLTHINRIIFVLSLIGIVIAIYVTQSFLRDAPIVCLNNGCELVRKSPYSYLLGIPVPVFGLIGYSLIASIAFLRTLKDRPIYLTTSTIIATGGVAFVTWFTTIELTVIKAICTWCAISAINMVALCLLTWYSMSIRKRI